MTSEYHSAAYLIVASLWGFGCNAKPDNPAPASSPSSAAASGAATAGPVVIAGIAIQPTADFGVGNDHVWMITFNEVDNPEEAAEWAKGIRGFEMTAAAAPTEPASAWNRVGPGDRVTLECTSRLRVTELNGCKLAGFKDTNYSLEPSR